MITVSEHVDRAAIRPIIQIVKAYGEACDNQVIATSVTRSIESGIAKETGLKPKQFSIVGFKQLGVGRQAIVVMVVSVEMQNG